MNNFHKGHYRVSRFILSRKTNVPYISYEDGIHFPFKNSVMSDFFRWETSAGLGKGMVAEVCNVRLREIKSMYELETGKIPVILNCKEYPNKWLFSSLFLFWLSGQVIIFENKLKENKRRKL